MGDISYVTINGKDYLPRKEHEKIEKRKQLDKYCILGFLNSIFGVGIPIVYITNLVTNKQSLIEGIKNSNLETLIFWGTLSLANLFGAFDNLPKAYRLEKELNRLEKELKNG